MPPSPPYSFVLQPFYPSDRLKGILVLLPLLRMQNSSADIVEGIQNLGWRFYIIFAVINLVWLPFIWYFYVETAGLSLDEIDRVFELKHAPGATMTYQEATMLAKEEIEHERILIGQKPHDGKEQIE